MQNLNVTLIQTELAWENIGANLMHFDHSIDAVEAPTDLIVLPEMFSTGFSMNAHALAEPMTGKAVTWIRNKAAKKEVTIVGSVMIQDNGKYYNRLLWACPDGRIILYDKKHLFRYAGEEKVYTAGKDIITVELKGWKIRPFICYDLRFPIWTRNLGLAYDLSLFVANWPAKRAPHWRALLRARAGGLQPASPTPTPMRAMSRCQKFMASPESAVMALHTASATAMRLRRLC